MQAPSTRLLVLMFTDLVDSTRLKRELGPEAYRPLAMRHDEIVRQALSAAATGRILQDTGDGYFIGFDTVSDALNAALMFQWLMRRGPWPVPFASRLGCHLGQVEEMQSGASGRPKILASAADMAARIMSLARGGQILLTRSVFDEARQLVREHPTVEGTESAPPLRWVAHGPYQLSGIDEPVDVFEVGAEGVAPLAPPPDTEKARRYIRPGEEITLGWRPAVSRGLENQPHWILNKKLGEGGFGEVWLALHSKTRAARVFKFCFDAHRLRSLKREVVLFRLLKEALGDRRDVSRIIDWQFEAPPYFVEMDYAPDGNLIDWAASRGGLDRIPLEQRLRIVAQVADALSAAHSVGILHKDIKPANVLMIRDANGDWHPRLTDFGIGILTDRSQLEDLNITAEGFTASRMIRDDSSGASTRMYAPPESLANRPHTIQGDVYSLGVLLYQMIVGDLRRPLAEGWQRDVIDPLLREDVAACVEGDPGRRLASAADVARRLNTLDARRTQRAQEERARALAQRRKRMLRAGGTGLLILATLLCIIVFAYARERKLNDSLTVAKANLETTNNGLTAAKGELEKMNQRRLEEVGRLLAVARQLNADPKVLERLAELEATFDRTPIVNPVQLPGGWKNELGMEFRDIQAGEFMMGRPDGEDGDESELPRHRVRITRPFSIGVTEVTRGQWRAMMGLDEYQKAIPDDCPIHTITLKQISEFCKRLSDRYPQHIYRLPTEAEWEYACRAGESTEFNTGDGADRLSLAGWFETNADKMSHPVRQKKPNAWGLYDMHGNVWEWTQDYEGDYRDLPMDDPVNLKPAARRVTRGGSWFNEPRFCRSAFRGFFAETVGNAFGFRLAAEPNPNRQSAKP